MRFWFSYGLEVMKAEVEWCWRRWVVYWLIVIAIVVVVVNIDWPRPRPAEFRCASSSSDNVGIAWPDSRMASSIVFEVWEEHVDDDFDHFRARERK